MRVFLLTSLWLVSLGITAALAQQQTQAPTPPTCEQQLDAVMTQIIQLRKANAQSEFRAASVEEQALSLSKQLAAEKAKSNAVKSEAKPK